MPWTVAIYLEDRAYGGPEEGGWFYNYGIPSDEHAQYVMGFDNEDEANMYASMLNEIVCPTLNKGRPSIDSVLSEGRFTAIPFEGFPRPWPVHKPIYE